MRSVALVQALANNEIGHQEIYLELGAVKGHVESLSRTLVEHTRASAADKAAITTRMDGLAQTVHTGLGITLCCSFVIPLLVTLAIFLIPRLTGGPVSARPESVERSEQIDGSRRYPGSAATGER